MANSKSEAKTSKSRFTKSEKLIAVLTVAWFVWGAKVFLFPPYDYSPGEPGDFFSAALVFLLAYVTYMQMEQMKRQEKENYEASILRAYELLRPDLEGVAAQVVSKLVKSAVLTVGSSEAELKEKFVKDRSVYMRELHKLEPLSRHINKDYAASPQQKQDLESARKACERYGQLIGALVENLDEDNPNNKGSKVAKAIKATDVYMANTVVEAIEKAIK